MYTTDKMKMSASLGEHIKALNNEKANSTYRYTSVEDLLKSPKDLIAMIEHHQTYQVPRLRILQDYSRGHNTGIWTRRARKNPEHSDIRIAHDYGGYISDFYANYVIGRPALIDYKTDEDNNEFNEAMKDYNRDNDVDSLNARLATSLSKYGRAFETQYRNRQDEDIIRELPVFNTFMIYDKTIESNELIGVYYVTSNNIRTVELHTDSEVIFVQIKTNVKDKITIFDRKPHDYGEVSITEYWNGDADRQGDYEKVISKIDSYDSTRSDLSNHMSDVNESLTVMTGAVSSLIESDNEDVTGFVAESNLLLLEYQLDNEGNPLPLDIQQIVRQYDVSGSEAHMDRLENDIHKLSYTPNFSDSNFANTSTGIAMMLKFYLSDQKARSKIHEFSKGLKKRYRVWANFKIEQEELKEFIPRNLTVRMRTNPPTSPMDEITAYIGTGGRLSEETHMSQLSIITDVSKEQERIANEERQRMSDAGLLYDYQVPQRAGDS